MVLITDKFGKPSADDSYASATTVKTERLASETVLSCFDLSSYDEETPLYFITYRKSIDPVTSEVSIVNQTSWKGIVNKDSNTITDLVAAPGYTDAGNLVGDYVESITTSYWGNSLIDGISTSLNPDGTLKADTVGAGQLQSNAVTTAKLADKSVTSAKIDHSTIGYASGVFDSSTTGNKKITLGFKPRYIKFTGTYQNESIASQNTGYWDDNVTWFASSASRYSASKSASRFGVNEVNRVCVILALSATGVVTYDSEIRKVSLDSDGFTINVASAYPVASGRFIYEAYE